MIRFCIAILDLYDRHGILKRPHVRQAIALAWLLLLTVLLVQPSSQPVIGPPAPPGQPSLAREVMLAAGHVGGFALLALLGWWALSASLPARRALFVVVSFALIYGAITEAAQVFSIHRSPSLFDLAINWAVTLGIAAWIAIYRRGLQ